ncbi:lamin tail domain-containing protein [Actinocorallia aurantiaca]|uniref:Endonuclease/exonuclease/phosphatase family protein n=1 Tax=Actinocorallia aurantiaca TaxID=46204 RepID=A0ABP6GMY0_9ACTN
MTTPLAAPRRASRFGWLLAALSLPVALAAAPPAHAASADLLISEVYGGGGNSGAVLTNDFIELANAGTAPLSLDGYSVQYISASPGASTTWQVTPLGGTVPAGGRFLVQEAAGSGGTLALPAPDAVGSIPMSATNGTVALVAGTDALTCKTAADCAADASVKDLVGFGSAVVREGTAAPVLSNTTSSARSALVDTDVNSADFRSGVPTPTNAAGQTVDVEGPGGEPPAAKRIRDVQGTTRISPLNGQNVADVPGVVTGVRASGSRGFWIQDPEPDADPATSEGVFVYTDAVPAVEAGDSVLVSGRVTEYRPGGGANQTLTEITAPTVTKTGSGNALPDAAAIGPGTLPGAYVAQPGGSVEGLPLAPSQSTLDWFEAHEGMRVSVADTRVVSAANEYGEMWVETEPGQNPTPRGGVIYKSYETPNNGRIKIIPMAGDAPKVDVGDTLKGTSAGPLDYQQYGGYTMIASQVGTERDGGLKRQAVKRHKAGSLSIATYNVENLAATNDDAKFARLAEGVVGNLASPDIVALEEIQDDNGPTGDGTVGAEKTLAKFAAAIQKAGGPKYRWRQIDPVDGADGGQPGGNIRQAFLFDPERVDFVDREGGDATTAVAVVKGKKKNDVRLSVSPGRVNPGSDAWESSRKPLAGEFVFHGEKYFVIANHFASKGGDDALHGRYQPPTRGSEVQRLKQAGELNAFVKELSTASSGKAKVVVLGDINDFQFSPVMTTLTGGGADLFNLMGTLPENERYSYVFDGNSQALDHILVSPSIKGYSYGVVHINAEFSDKASDHDPQVVHLPPGCDGGKPAFLCKAPLPYKTK